MQAIVCPTPGGPEALVLEEKVNVPIAKDTDLLVDMKCAGLNYIDTYIRSGLYPNPAPHIIGREGSGVVCQVGSSVSGWAVGDRVSFFSPGSYAEKAAVPAAKCIKLPNSISFEQGASMALQGLTAHYLTRSTYELKKGDTCLIHAGAGGTGGLMIQMAKIAGAVVITTVGSKAKELVAKGAGADHVINYSETNFQEEVMKYTSNKGVCVVYDGVGAATWEKSLKCLRPRGMLVLFGNASGKVPPIDPLMLAKNGSLFVTRPSLAHYIATPEEFNARAADLVTWLGSKQLTIRVDKVFPLHQAKEAHTYLESRAAMGKILLSVV